MLNPQGKKTVNKTTSSHFEEGGSLSETHHLLSETRENTEKGNKYYDDSTMPPLISKEEMDAMSSGDEYEYGPMSTEMLEDIRDVSQSHPIVNRRYARYKIRDCIKQGQSE